MIETFLIRFIKCICVVGLIVSVTNVNAQITAQLDSTADESCAGLCDGLAAISWSGGVGPVYQVIFLDNLSDTVRDVFTTDFADTVTTLCGAGSKFTAIVKDLGNSPDEAFVFNISIDAGGAIVPLQPNIDSASCNGVADGSITVNLTASGSPPYTHYWNTGDTTFGVLSSTYSGIPAGIYTDTIVNSAGCRKIVTYSVFQPAVVVPNVSRTNVTCNGAADGTASSSPSGGNGGPYTHLWNTGATTSSISGLGPGTYCDTVTDNNGCSEFQCVVITQPGPLTPNLVTVDISCFGANDGEASVSPSGAFSPYNVLWSTGETTDTILGLIKGPYGVTVTDNSGNCSEILAFTINEPDSIDPDITSTNITCNGDDDGMIITSASGGNSPYTYSWSHDGALTTFFATGLNPGNYTITVTDSKLCDTITTINISEPDILLANASATDISCNGLGDGQVTSVPTGGTSPFNFNWDIPSTLQTVTGLSQGSYAVTVTDDNGCFSEQTVSISEPSTLNINFNSVDISCFGANDGEASVDPAGGITPYTVSWSPPIVTTGDTAFGLAQGAYSVTVSDANGCTGTQPFTINEPTEILPNSVGSDVTCFSGNDGYITTAVVGGSGSGYIYLWAPGGESTDSIGSLVQGSYTVTITDDQGCSGVETTVINESSDIISNINGTNPICNGINDGTVTTNPSGGVGPPYTFVWNTGATTQNISGLGNGTYFVTISDGVCSITDFRTITAPNSILLNGTQTNISCNGICDGSATINPSGGVTPYAVSWSTGSTSNTVSSLCGPVSVTITDATGCSSDSTFNIISPSIITVTFNRDSASCDGICDGQASVIPSGGVGPYTYLWPSSAGGGSDSTTTGLCVGTYTVTVTDGNGCTGTGIVDIPGIIEITLNFVIDQIDCQVPVCNGAATVSVNDGAPPYSLIWNDGGASTTNSVTGLCSGFYTVTATDIIGCRGIDSVNIPATPAVINAGGNEIGVTCHGFSDGQAVSSVTGGTSPFSYSWSHDVLLTTSSATGLIAGVYNVSITDINGCTDTSNINVSEPDTLIPNMLDSDVSCFGNGNGSITALPSGGTSGYNYQWNNPSSSTTATITGLSPGFYSLTLTDALACVTIDSIEITQPNELKSLISVTSVACNGDCNGSATLTPLGGTPGYSYLWDAAAGSQTSATATGLCADTFFVTITDIAGCTLDTSAIITEPTDVSINSTLVHVLCNSECTGSYSTAASGGTSPYSYSWSHNGTLTTAGATGLCSGSYSVTVTDAKGCVKQESKTITEPSLLNVTLSTVDITCFGSNSGSASVAISDGVSPYTVIWSDGQTGTTATGLIAGNFSVTVTDDNLCDSVILFTINTATQMIANEGSVNSNCSSSDGSAFVQPIGGSGGYTFTWDMGCTTDSCTGLAAGVYNVTISDVADPSCSINETVTVSNFNAPTGANISLTHASCYGVCDGTATVLNVTGGSSPFTYDWINAGPQTGTSATGLCDGTYTLKITDAIGCLKFENVVITEPDSIMSNFITTTTSCAGDCDGTATVNPTGGVSPYTFSWLSGESVNSVTGLCAGSVSVTITDATGCVNLDPDTVIDFGNTLVLSSDTTHVNCNGSSTGAISVSLSGGSTPFSFVWNTGDNGSLITGLSAGSYMVTASDAVGCSLVDTIPVFESNPIFDNDSVVQSNCAGTSGEIYLFPSGGIGNYGYSWSHDAGNTTSTVTGVGAAAYSVTITDDSLCSKAFLIAVSNGDGPVISSSASPVSCPGNCNGQVNASVTSGTSPFSFLWSTGVTTAAVTGLCTGNYSVTMNDASGCSAVSAVTVNEPAALDVNFTTSNISCSGISDGSVLALPVNGIVPVSYLWNTGANTQFISGLTSGTYIVTLTDGNGCTISDTAEIISPSPLNISFTTTDVMCFSNCNGTSIVSASGGAGGFSYVWGTGATTQVVAGLCADMYTITVSDQNGCSLVDSTEITSPTEITSTPTISLPLCGVCDGSISLSISGGSGVYNYTWLPGGQTSTSVSGLCAGSYSVIVTDNSGCMKSFTYVLPNSNGPTVNASGTDPVCFGNCNGSVTGLISGGISPYSIAWNTAPVQTITSVSGLCSGTYLMNVTDNNGCLGIDSVTIDAPDPLTTSHLSSDLNCNVLCDITSLITVNGGNGGFSYNWSSGSTTDTQTGLCSGNYPVSITDVLGCSLVDNVVITENSPLSIVLTGIPPNCFGICDGVVTSSVSGGVFPYSYTWNGTSQTTSSVTDLCDGSYFVTVTDGSGCNINDSITIVQPSILTGIITESPASCNGGINGSLSAAIAGGTPAYNYNWNNGDIDSLAGGLLQGTYNLTVSDNNGCQLLLSGTVSEPSPVVLDSLVTTQPPCGDSTGTAEIFVSGGIGTYTYLWDNGETTSNVDTLNAGIHQVTVTDNSVCSSTFSTIITSIGGPSLSISQTPLDCSGDSDGSLTVTATGGSTPYNYQWNAAAGSATTSSVSGLSAGNYSVSVTDAALCVSATLDTIINPDPLFVLINSTGPLCSGDANGVIDINATGGTGNLNFIWNTGQITDSIFNLTSGNYCFTITDNNGCSFDSCISITAPNPLDVIMSWNNLSCFGDTNASATAVPSGGSTPYSYIWSNGKTTQVNNDLTLGVYGVTVSDANGCSDIGSANVTQPSEILVNINSYLPDCGVNNGAIAVSVSGGLPAVSGYTYSWNSGETTDSIFSLSQGNYCVTVNDSVGCKIDTCAFLPNLNGPTITLDTLITPDCPGSLNGEIQITISGSDGPPFSVIWSTGSTSEDISALVAGPYSITVTDTLGCVSVEDTILNDPDDIAIAFNILNESCADAAGQVAALVSGGTGAFTYNWSIPSVNDTISGLTAGIYDLTVTDVNGCSDNSSAVVQNINFDSILVNQPVLNCFNDTGSVTVTPFGGSSPYSFLWSDGQTNSTATGFSPGIYNVTISDNGSCVQDTLITVVGPSAFTMDTVIANEPSCGSSAGSLELLVSGASPGYNYLWDVSAGSQTTALATGLTAGAYLVTVSDNLGCDSVFALGLGNIDGPTVTYSMTEVTCNSTNDGSMTATPSGGVSPYTFNWSNGNTNATATGLTAGIHFLTVTDATSCMSITSDTMTQETGLSANVLVNNITCNGAADGQIQVVPTSGISPYSFIWNTGATSGTITGLNSGMFHYTVTDAASCSKIDSAEIIEPDLLVVGLTTVDNICFGDCSGQGSVLISGGTTPYSISWSNGATTSATIGMCSGGQSVTVTDAQGCFETVGFSIISPSAISLDSLITNLPTCNDSDGTITAFISGGISGYNYSWSSNVTTFIDSFASVLVAGSYSLSVTDFNSCDTSFTTALSNLNGPATNLDSVAQNLCFGDSTGLIQITPTGSNQPYSYLWSNGETNEDIDSLVNGIYQVTITDTLGCLTFIDTVISSPDSIIFNLSSTNESCGDASGSVNSSVTGGVSPYSYLWTGGSTLSTISALNAGNYSLSLTDGNGCLMVDSVAIINVAFDSLIVSSTTISCFGETASISVSPYGGIQPYSYLWAGGQTDSLITGLPSGNYSVTITDAGSCSIDTSKTITSPFELTLDSLVINEPTCSSLNGDAAVNMSGGIQPYSYLWDSGAGNQTTATATGLPAGSYFVTVTDLNFCDTVFSVNISNINGPSVTTSSINVSCNATNDGEIIALVSGGTSPYILNWSSGSSNDTASTLVPGIYNLTVTDAVGCITIVTDTVNQDPGIVADLTFSNISCFGLNDGIASINVVSGQSPYDFIWTTAATTSSVTNLSSGPFSVTVSDAVGCIVVENGSITEPSPIATTLAITDNICFGECFGSVEIFPTGGSGTIDAIWNTGATGTSVSSLCNGSYSVTLTDTSSCTFDTTVQVSSPNQFIQDSISLVSPTCNDSNGVIVSWISGGTPGFTYLWDAVVTNSNDSMATLLEAGNYNLTLTDILGCDTVFGYPLSNINGPEITVDSIVDINCAGDSSGAIDITPTGASQPYSFNWSNGQTTEDVSQLLAGNYLLTITDTIGCITILDTLVNESQIMSFNESILDALCDSANGNITLAVTGGFGPYNYLWSSGQTTSVLDSLVAGSYCLTVTDSSGCEINTCFAVNNLGGPDSVAITTSDVSCFGFGDGSASLATFGGAVPYTFLWSPGGFTTSSVSSIAANTYTVIITDSNNCSRTEIFNVDQPAEISATFTNVIPTCGDSNGVAQVNPIGGVSPFSFSWNDPLAQSTQSATGLFPGIYTVSLSDNNGCANIISTVLENGTASIFTSTVDVTCFGGNDGVFIIDSITGSDGPFNQLLIPVGSSADSTFGLSAGTFFVQATDTIGCITLDTFQISQPSELIAQFTVNEASCGFCNGDASAVVTGGVSPYSVLWGTGGTTDSINFLCPGVYQYEVTDANGCEFNHQLPVSNVVPDSLEIVVIDATCNSICDGQATVTVFGGAPPYVYFWVGTSQTTGTVTGMCTGTYQVEVTDANGCIKIGTVEIGAPDVPSDSALVVMPECGVSDGSISIFLSGGVLPYLYNWSTGSTLSSVSGLSAAQYVLSVTENNGLGCITEYTYNLNNNNAPVLTMSGSDVLCAGQCDGQASVGISGGSSPYGILWSPGGETTTLVSGLCAGQPGVQVTDAVGCISTGNISIGSPSILGTSIPGTTQISCFGDCNASSTMIPSGGQVPYNYLWDPNAGSQTTATANGLCSGTFVVTISDDNGCNVVDSVSLFDPPALSLTFDSTSATCVETSDGQGLVIATGGTPGYSYLWNDPLGQNTDTLINVAPGWYSVTVSDINGCNLNDSLPIDTLITVIVVAMQDTTICNGDSVDLSAIGTGAVGIAYQWTWDNGNGSSTNQSITVNPLPGTWVYEVSANFSGCIANDSAVVIVNAAPFVDAGENSQIYEGLTSVIGGNPAAPTGSSVSWFPTDWLSNDLSPNPETSAEITTMYYLTAVDSNGCSSTDSILVTVIPDVKVPSGFSPNGDGMNDYWSIDNVEKFPDIFVQIYNRWGQLLFESTGYETPWDGNFNNNPLPVGTYYYIVELNHSEFPDPLTGPVTILR